MLFCANIVVMLCVGNINERGMLLLFSTLEIILQCFPKEGPVLLQPVLQRLLILLLSDKESGLTVSSKFCGFVTPGPGFNPPSAVYVVLCLLI